LSAPLNFLTATKVFSATTPWKTEPKPPSQVSDHQNNCWLLLPHRKSLLADALSHSLVLSEVFILPFFLFLHIM